MIVLLLDENRAKSGLNLRAVFAFESGVYNEDVHDGPCSVLEMLVALAENIATEAGDFVSKWFWEMISNLELMNCSDENYNANYIDARLDIWMRRQYDASGKGNIFEIPNFDGDMRNMEIWNQKNAYLTELYPQETDWL